MGGLDFGFAPAARRNYLQAPHAAVADQGVLWTMHSTRGRPEATWPERLVTG